jgi:hypothetical protein
MTSKLKVNILADGGDNAIMTSDGSGTLTLNNTALKNTPAFLAYNNGGQTISNLTATIVTLNAEVFDSDGKFNTSDYKFTPTVAGKYFLFGQSRLNTDVNFNTFEVAIYLNGSTELARATGVYGHYDAFHTSTIADLDADDYIQLRIYQGSGSDKALSDGFKYTFLGGYRIIGA